MGKKFFLKYLPVKGEVKVGDSFFSATNEAILVTMQHGADLANKNKVKKVKLFLCSRDIQAGDTVQRDGSNTKYRIEDKSETHKNLSKYKNENYFKVVGQVSSAATWVKEGDEFEFIKDCFISNSEIGQLDTYKIKGPCGHFH